MAPQDVTTFVQALKDFREHLPQRQQAMLDHLIAAAQHHDTAGYGRHWGRPEQSPPQDDTAGYGRWRRTEPDQGAQQDDDTAGYGRMIPNTDTGQMEDMATYLPRTGSAQAGDQATAAGDTHVAAQGDEDRWTSLAAWLSREDDTGGYGFRWG